MKILSKLERDERQIIFSKFFIPAIFFSLTIAIPLFFLLSWHQINTVGPRADAAEYYRTAQEIHQKFVQDGFLRGLQAIYMLRGWRPIFFPIIILPFVALTGSQILLAVALTQSFLLTIFIIYAYLLSREYLSALRSSVAVLFVTSLFWFMDSAYVIFSELSLIACFMGVLYHLKKSMFFTVRKHAIFFALWAAVAMAIRPVEFVFAFIIPFFVILYLANKKEKIISSDIRETLIYLLPLGTLFAAITFLPFHRDKFIPLALLILASIYFSRQQRKKAGGNLIYLDSFFLLFVLTLVWWFPGVKKLYWWTYETTFGNIAFYYHDQGKMGTLEAIGAFFSHLGGYPLLLTSVLAVFGLGGLLFNKREKRSDIVEHLKLIALCFTMLLPPILMLSQTNDIAYRRSMHGFAAFHLAICVLALHPKLFAPKLRFFLISAFVAAQLFALYCKTFDVFSEMRGKMWPYFQHTASPLKGGDPTAKLFKAIEPYHARKASVAVFSARGIGAGELNMHASGNGSNLIFGYPSFFSNLNEGYEQLRRFNYVLLDASTAFSSEQASREPYAGMTEDLTRRWNEKRLEELGLRLLATYKVTGAFDPSLKPPFYEIVFLEVRKSA